MQSHCIPATCRTASSNLTAESAGTWCGPQAKPRTRPGAAAMVLNGRRMGGLIWDEAAACDAKGMRAWLDLAKHFVGALPAK